MREKGRGIMKHFHKKMPVHVSGARSKNVLSCGAGRVGTAAEFARLYGVATTFVSEFTQWDEMQSNETGQILSQPPQLWESAAVLRQVPSGHTAAPAGQAGVVSVTTGVSSGVRVGVTVTVLLLPVQPAASRKAMTVAVSWTYVR